MCDGKYIGFPSWVPYLRPETRDPESRETLRPYARPSVRLRPKAKFTPYRITCWHENLSAVVWAATARCGTFQSLLLLIHQSVAQNLSDKWRSTFKIGVVHLRSVTEIALIETTVLTWEQKPYPVRMIFVAARKLSGIVYSKSAIETISIPVTFAPHPFPQTGSPLRSGGGRGGGGEGAVLTLQTISLFHMGSRLEPHQLQITQAI